MASEPVAAGEVNCEETMWAEMKPDLYAGETCDQQRARWHTYARGDKESGFEGGDIVLDPKLFPPGTRVIVLEPICPQCGETREHRYPRPEHGSFFQEKCDCGFDWEAWVGEQYS